MALTILVCALLAGVVAGDADADAARVTHHGSLYHPTIAPHHAPVAYTPSYHYPPAYGPAYAAVTPAYHAVTPAYHSVTPAYHSVTPNYHPHPYAPHPSYHAAPTYHHKCPYNYEEVPTCSYNTTKPWCLYDPEYPEYELKEALLYHKLSVLALYADVADLNTALSVYRPRRLDDETYLCPSDIGYLRPVRALNTDGHWRIIVNNIKVDYEVFTQTTRIEECASYSSCPLVPHCYESKCLQKSIYHRFLVYDPCDEYFPFSVETFRLPSTCACLLGASYIDH